MPNTTKYADISQRTAAWASSEMLSHAQPILVLQKFGKSKPLPKHKADTVKFRRPVPFGAATTPLVEGVTPTAQKMSYEDVQVQVKQYGKPIEISDQVVDMAEDPVLSDASMLAGEQAAETVEAVTYGVVKGGTSVTYGNGAARAVVNTAISLNKQRAVTRALNAQKAKKITSILDASVKYNTVPIEAGYVAIGHTDLDADVRNLAGFVPVAKYGSRKPICPEEIGSVEDVRYVLSADLGPFQAAGSATVNGMIADDATNVDVYPIIFFGRESFGCVPLKGHNAITPRVINPDTADKSDPMGQVGYVSWKTYFAAVILNELWLHRLEVGATDL